MSSEAYPEHLVEKAGQHEFEDIRDEAVEDLTEMLEVDSEAVPEIPVETEERGTTGGASYENGTMTVDLAPDLSDEPSWVEAEHLQAEGVYEEVNHILAEDIVEHETGQQRKSREDRTYWDNAANELLGTIYKWGDNWGFNRPLEKADTRLSKASERLDQSLAAINRDFEDRDLSEDENLDEYCKRHGEVEQELLGDIIHFIGYKVSEEAKDQDYDPAEVVRMSYDQLREEFSEEVEQAEEQLREEYGVLVDLDREIQSEEGFGFFVQTGENEYKSRGVLEGYEQHGRQFYTWEEDELPERVRN
jgi:hypothetical protein